MKRADQSIHDGGTIKLFLLRLILLLGRNKVDKSYFSAPRCRGRRWPYDKVLLVWQCPALLLVLKGMQEAPTVWEIKASNLSHRANDQA